MSKCNCFHGMDCNKISVCQAEQMVEDATEELEADNTRLREQLDKVREVERFIETMNTDAGQNGGYYNEFVETVHDMLKQALEGE